VLGAAAALLLVAVPSPALAHPVLDEAIERYRNGDFGGALELLEEAEHRDDLTRGDVVTMFRYRALVRFATGDREAMAGDLRGLAALDPDDGAGADAPPPVREAYAAARDETTPIALDVSVEDGAGHVRVVPRLRGGGDGLVRALRVGARPRGGRWEHAGGEPLTVPVPSRGPVEYWAAAIGPGGAPLVSVGSADEPLTHVAGPAATAPDEPRDGRSRALDRDDGGGDPVLVWGLVGAGVAAVAAAVVLAVVLTSDGADGGRDTQLGGPRLEL